MESEEFQIRRLSNEVKKKGIDEFIRKYYSYKDRENDPFTWGDEIEYMIVKIDDQKRTAKLCQTASRILHELCKENDDSSDAWRNEFLKCMVESSPVFPYDGSIGFINDVEMNMKLRREELKRVLASQEVPLTIASFPRFFCDHVTNSCGSFLSDLCEYHKNGNPGRCTCMITEDFRYHQISRNVQKRRQRLIEISRKVYQDFNTRLDNVRVELQCAQYSGCSLQLTFQTSNLTEARFVLDQLASTAPYMLSLSAASPVFHGYLTKDDTRWPIMSQNFDDRTKKQLKERPRWDSIACYSSDQHVLYNDVEYDFDKSCKDALISNGVNEVLANYISNLFYKDPLFVNKGENNANDDTMGSCFLNIDKTNWRTVRLKLPSATGNVGWAVEFRPMEVQITDFENAAYSVFVMVLVKMIIEYRLSFILPISMVDENMDRASKIDAVLNEKFYFRKMIFTDDTPEHVKIHFLLSNNLHQNGDTREFEEKDLNDIVNGFNTYPGLIPLMNYYLHEKCISLASLEPYLTLISERASGKRPTTARFIRDYVMNHPEYKQDSVVTETINYDLLKLLSKRSETKNVSSN